MTLHLFFRKGVMDIVEILGFTGAFLIGLILGLIGGGGSILTVPILVYALSFNPVIATAYSLFVVGSSAAVGAIKNMMKGKVDFKTAFTFAIPAFIAIYLTRAFLIPSVPDELFEVNGFVVTKNLGIMMFFAIVMLFAAIGMIAHNTPRVTQEYKYQPPKLLLIIYSLIIGFVTGAVGAGGGFLIVPTLVIFAKLSMKKAVATSLFIVAINSLIGFTGDMQHTAVEWGFLIPFTSLSIVGIFAGIWLSKFIDGKKLKKVFGWFVLIMGVYIIYKELTR
ncbi:MAG: putative membrane protein YfcA [Nonlabens sp.]